MKNTTTQDQKKNRPLINKGARKEEPEHLRIARKICAKHDDVFRALAKL